MINLKGFEGVDVTKGTYAEFISSMDTLGMQKHDLGLSSWEDKRVYGYSIGDPSKPTIFIYTLHAEWKDSYYVREFLREIVDNTNKLHYRLIKKIKERYHIFAIPAGNPYGLEYDKRRNFNYVDINRNFDWKWEEFDENAPGIYGGPKGSAPFSEPETRILRDAILEHKPFVSIECHTHFKDYLALEHGSPEFHLLFKDAMKSFHMTGGVSNNFVFNMDTLQPKGPSWTYGVARNDRGGRIMATAIEGYGFLEDNVKEMRDGKNMILSIIIHAINHYETQKLTTDGFGI